MARNGSGTFSNPYPTFVSGTTISSTQVNANNSDIATALTQSIAVDGQSAVTANLPMNAKKLTGLAVGAAATDSLNLGQAQAEAMHWCGTAGGSANAITLTPSPAITAYAAGQRFVWKASGSVNTGATTVAISGLGTIALQDNGAAFVAGNHAANKIFMGILDTASTMQVMQVQLSGTDPLLVSSLTVSGAATIGGVTTHGGNVVSDTDSTDDLGTASVRWKDLFVDSITATDQITATGFTGTLDGILGSGSAAAASVTTLTTSGIVSVDDTTTSTSGTTGSIHTDGGLGVAGTAFVAGTAKIVGVTTHGGNVVSDTDSTDDLGTTGVRWANLFVDAITATDQVTATGFTGTLDGVLGGGTPASASITTLGFTSLSGTGSVAITDILDEDNMASNSATKLSTQQSIKAYVDSQVGAADTLAEVLALGNTTTTDQKIQFRDTGIYLNSSADGQLDIVADTEIQIAATTIDINGAVALSGAITGATNITLSGELDAATLDISGNADIDGILEADAMTLNGTAITATATLDTGISNNNVPKFTSGVADNDFLRVDGTAVEGRSATEVLSDIAAAPAAGSSNIVTTGALNSGSITSGFGTIDTGSSTITTTGLISGGSLDIDSVLINGSTIGHTDDTDLMTVASGLLTVAGEVSMTTLDIGGTNVTSTAAELNILDGVTSTAAELNILDGVTTTAAELNYNDTGAAVGTVVASKTVTADANKDVASLRNLTITGEIDAATGDFSGAVDIDGALDVAGTTNLDVVDIDGAVNIAAATTIAAANKIQFRDAAIYLNSSADGQLDIVADTEIQIAATTIDINGAVALSGAITGATNITLSGELDAATGDFSGAVDIAGALTLGTDLAVAQGGTGASTFAANGILYGAGTGAIAATAVGTDGHVLTSNGSGVAPTFQAAGGGGASDINDLSDALTNSSGKTIGLGTGALANDDGSTNNNTALGYNALNTVETGYQHVAVGYEAGKDVTTAYSTSSFGYHAGRYITTGNDNVSVGHSANFNITTGNFCVGVGGYAGYTNVTSASNTAVGHYANFLNTGTNNVAVGREANYGGTGTSNTAVGTYALRGQGAKTYNTGVGSYALYALTSGTYNTGIGYRAGGAFATNSLTTGSNNTLLGYLAVPSAATVSNEITLGNTAVTKFRIPGINFVIKDTTATDNYVLTVDANGEAGWEAAAAAGATDINGLSDALVENNSIFLGNDPSGTTSTASNNVAVGTTALDSITTGDSNVAVGYNSATALTTGEFNTAVGNTSLLSLTTGTLNVAIGSDAGQKITTGYGNICVGDGAGYDITDGNKNIMIGRYSGHTGSDFTGSNNIVMGYLADASSQTVSNEITLGDGNISSLRCQVQTISSLSDRRDKKNIEELPLGIDFINTLKPVKFTWNMRDGAKVGQQEAGFIAQDLDEAQIDAGAEDYLSLVLKNNPEKLEASYGKLVPVLVKAVQELSNEIEKLKKEIKNGR